MVFEAFIKNNYASYESYLASRKVMASPFMVSEVKDNHPSSIYAETPLTSTHIFGEVNLSCEVSKTNNSDFSLRILSTITPHYHRFDSQGYLLAYQTDAMKDDTQTSNWKDIEKAFDYFCQSGNIHTSLPDDKPRIVVSTGNLPLDFGDDPTNGLNF